MRHRLTLFAIVLSLTDVLHRPKPSSPSMAAATLPNDGPPNRWVTLDSTTGYLAALMHIPPGRVTSAYHRFDSSLPLAIESLLNNLEAERPFDSLPDADRLLSELATVLPDHSMAGLVRLLSATEGDASDAMDLKVKLEEIAREEGSPLLNGLFGFGGGGDKRRVAVVHSNSTLEPILPTPLLVATPGGWVKVANVAARPTSTLSSTISARKRSNAPRGTASFSSEHSSSLDCQAHALIYLEKRNEAFRSAAKHFQSGGSGRGAAWYWAETGREMDRRKKVWEARAAFALVGERRYV